MGVPPLALLKRGGHPSIVFLKSNVDWKILYQVNKAKNFSASADTNANASVSINACTSASASVSISACTGASASASANIFPKLLRLNESLHQIYSEYMGISVQFLFGF